MIEDRYSRQVNFGKIGEDGQKKLMESTVVIIGLGALGTVCANNLCRAGVGHIKLIDRDYVEISNLQRQTLYDEMDVLNEKPKVIAAYDHLRRINSSVTVEPIIAHIGQVNIEEMIRNSDLVLDCTDNFETRYLINEACHKQRVPWIYCGAIGSNCMTMNIIPNQTPCFMCFAGENDNLHNGDTCSTIGVLNMVTGIAASYQSAEAIKILLKSEDVRTTMLYMDIWDSATEYIEVMRNPHCPVCSENKFDHLKAGQSTSATVLCGKNEIQVIPRKVWKPDFHQLSFGLSNLGKVDYNQFVLTFQQDSFTVKLFGDGRALIKNAKDENHAIAIYTEFFGG